MINEFTLKKKTLEALRKQGFIVNPTLRPKRNTKDTYRKVHSFKKMEVLRKHKFFLQKNFNLVKKYACPSDFDPKKITLEIREVKADSEDAKIFFWHNLMWWSLPYDRAIGRQMKFIIWDTHHNAPFGLIGLQSPPLRMSIRDKYLGLDKNNVDYWINMSLYGQRIGALPPYNELLGGKFVSMCLTCNEIREAYKKKYFKNATLLKKRKIPSQLLFISTTSAFGRSPIYERLNYSNEPVSYFLGYTSGSGTFHIPDSLYEDMLFFLSKKGYDVKRGYGTGPSRKLKLVSRSLELLGLNDFGYHMIKRGFYIFPNVKNLHQVIQKNEKPKWCDRSFNEMFVYWLNRWCIPRSERTRDWKQVKSDNLFKKYESEIKKL